MRLDPHVWYTENNGNGSLKIIIMIMEWIREQINYERGDEKKKVRIA